MAVAMVNVLASVRSERILSAANWADAVSEGNWVRVIYDGG